MKFFENTKGNISKKKDFMLFYLHEIRYDHIARG